jgi:hypothetical protein
MIGRNPSFRNFSPQDTHEVPWDRTQDSALIMQLTASVTAQFDTDFKQAKHFTHRDGILRHVHVFMARKLNT